MLCECGAVIKASGKRLHYETAKHREGVVLQEMPQEVPSSPVEATKALHPDLEAALREKNPQLMAKMVRHFWGAMEWPNEEHPETVREFLLKHDKQVVDTVLRLPPLDPGRAAQGPGPGRSEVVNMAGQALKE